VAGLLAQGGRNPAQGSLRAALLIVIVPMVILQCVLTYVFMERHWQLVTKRFHRIGWEYNSNW
jgi:hypothetical protein